MSRTRVSVTCYLAVLLAAGGCTATIGAGEEPPERQSEHPKETETIPDSPILPVQARVWRLTRAQYDNTVHDLLGDTTAPARAFLPEEGGTGFDNAELQLGFKDTNMAEFNRAARKLAEAAVGPPERLAQLFPCGEAQLEDQACGMRFVVEFGRRAFRRPLDAEETARYQQLFTAAKQALGARGAIQVVVETMLQSPHFLFREELGHGAPDAAGRVRLTSHEVAAQLSYTLWNSMPDAELAAAADRDALDPRELERQTRRLLEDPRAKTVIADLFLQMMDYRHIGDLSKDAPYGSAFGKVKTSLVQETARFVTEVLWNDDGTLSRLFTAPYTMGNAAVAEVYGVPAPAGSNWQRLPLDAHDRAGLLTHPGLMAVTSHPDGTSPVLRGKFVAERLLCTPVPDPPEDVTIEPPTPSTAKTTRQQYEAHATVPSCAACHKFLDASGYAFEHLDPVGRVRREENGLPIDTSGGLHGSDVDGPLSGVAELARKLADSTQARDCLAKHVFRFVGGRKEGSGDEPALRELASRFAKGGWQVKELFVAHVLSERFVTRLAD